MTYIDNKIAPFTIVGGGIIGLSIALKLQAAHIKVQLIEKNLVGSGASHGNAGHIATEQVFPIADLSILKKLPSMLLDPLGPLRLDWQYLLSITPWALRLLKNMSPKKSYQIHQALTSINSVSLQSWRQFINDWALSPYIKINGSLLVTEKEQNIQELQKHGAYLNSIGVQNEWISQDRLHDMEPHLANNQLGALFYPQTGHIVDLEAVTEQLKRSFLNLGGVIHEHTEIISIQKKSSQLIELKSSNRQFTSQNVVIACGAYSKSLTKMLSGINIPLETERGYHLMLPQEEMRLALPVSSIDRRFIMTPMTQGLRLAGTVEFAGLKKPPNMQRARNFIPLANPMLKTQLNTEGATEWMGFRPSTSDSLPIIDKQDNCYFAFGHQHLGLTQAAITAEIIMNLHFNQPPCIDYQPFSINRFN